jgi:CubicO group peptidase (beta-lactamase class C family)
MTLSHISHSNSRLCLHTIALIFFLFITCLQDSLAQQAGYFKTAGRKVDIRNFNAEVVRLMDAVGIPGVSLAVIEHNKVVFYNTYGYKQSDAQETVDQETLFEACSLSKNFMLFMVYRLVDQQKLDLDKPLYQYLEYERLKHDARYRQITARMILGHCSGIENWKADFNPDTLDIVSNPGEKFIYSGEGFHYLARVIETLEKEPYQDIEKRMVFSPLQLERTFSSFKDSGTYPVNYAQGHDVMEKKVNKWKNKSVFPAGGINTTAMDYAHLLIGMFNGKYLSRDRVNDILHPTISLKEYFPPNHYFGGGYEVIYSPNDTIIAHGGSNPGYKCQVFYSVVNKRGLIFMTNSDRGKLITQRLVDMSVRLDVKSEFAKQYYEQYPSNAITLLDKYKKAGAGPMIADVEKLKAEGKLGVNTLNELGHIFIGVDTAVARKLLVQNIALYPASSKAFYLLGTLDMKQKYYNAAYDDFIKAKALHSDEFTLDFNLRKCEQEIRKQAGYSQSSSAAASQ